MRPCNEVFRLMLLIRLRWDEPVERPVPGVQRLSEERWFVSCQTSLNFTPNRCYRFIYYYASFTITLERFTNRTPGTGYQIGLSSEICDFSC